MGGLVREFPWKVFCWLCASCWEGSLTLVWRILTLNLHSPLRPWFPARFLYGVYTPVEKRGMNSRGSFSKGLCKGGMYKWMQRESSTTHSLSSWTSATFWGLGHNLANNRFRPLSPIHSGSEEYVVPVGFKGNLSLLGIFRFQWNSANVSFYGDIYIYIYVHI